jgi:hypothetical protein
MPEDAPSLDYVLISEGCEFTFPEGTEGESVNFAQAPKHIRFAFQGRALAQFIRACIRSLADSWTKPLRGTRNASPA